MLKKTLKYTDYEGNEVTEDLYFNLNKLEVTRMAARYGGDIEKHIEKVIAKQDLSEMMNVLEDLILSSYGVKSEDGKRFIKTKEIREDFEYSIAYSEIFSEILLNPEETKKFGMGLVAATDKPSLM